MEKASSIDFSDSEEEKNPSEKSGYDMEINYNKTI